MIPTVVFRKIFVVRRSPDFLMLLIADARCVSSSDYYVRWPRITCVFAWFSHVADCWRSLCFVERLLRPLAQNYVRFTFPGLGDESRLGLAARNRRCCDNTRHQSATCEQPHCFASGANDCWARKPLASCIHILLRVFNKSPQISFIFIFRCNTVYDSLLTFVFFKKKYSSCH